MRSLLVKLCAIMIFGVLIQCHSKDYAKIAIPVLENKFSFVIDTSDFHFVFDTINHMPGDPEGLRFYTRKGDYALSIFIGYRSPSAWWKETFDFEEKYLPLKAQIELNPTASFIKNDEYRIRDFKVKSV